MELSFGKQNLNPERQEIKDLQARITQLEARLGQEKQPIAPETKTEKVKAEIKDYIKEVQQTPSFAAPQATRDELKEIKKFPAAQQVGTLVSLALSDGLAKAVSLASALNNPAILDEFHDTLADNYFDQLVQAGIIKLI